MSYRSFVYSVDDGIATIRLNDPERLNALTFETYAELERVFAALANASEVKVVVLTGTGKGFCSGGSVHGIIAKLLEMNAEEQHRFTRLTCDVVKNMRSLKKPIIAAVNGIAAGAGAVLALAGDLRILSERARFSFLFTKVGLSGADMGACHLLPRIVGQGRAAELLFTGEVIDAQECFRIGLANRVTSHENLMDSVYELARKLKDGPSEALAVTKQLLDREADMDLGEALALEAAEQARLMQSADFQEGYRAFVEKRPAKFNRS
ncbi:MAG TPA: enoyl-CoA hydratase family protein [Candidatus Binatia bacterium]|nr:enoyl-CoA hydratase family protein [Candidatus Binatia bacterium]